jgi:hypothetical protein
MPAQLQLRKDELIIDGHLEPAAQGGQEADGLDLRFKILEQFSYQAHGPVSVVSNRTIFDANLHKSILLGMNIKIISLFSR